MRLSDRMAYVTGAASGNGAAIARALAAEGAAVAVADVSSDAAEAVAASIRAAGGRALALDHDVGDEAAWRRCVDAAVQALGPLRVMVNNAGIASAVEFEDETLENWRNVQRVNLDGVFLGTREAVRRMKSVDAPSSIVNISSVYGQVGAPMTAAYNASKGGVRLLTKSVALYCEQKRYPIRVNSVHPGYIRTPMIEEGVTRRFGAARHAEMLARMKATTPMGRLGEAGEVAAAVLFLASDDASFMTGSELTVDGGFTAQ